MRSSKPVKHKAMVVGLRRFGARTIWIKRSKKRPFLVRHEVSCQAGLHRRYQLESDPFSAVNPFYSHDLNLINYIFNNIIYK